MQLLDSVMFASQHNYVVAIACYTGECRLTSNDLLIMYLEGYENRTCTEFSEILFTYVSDCFWIDVMENILCGNFCFDSLTSQNAMKWFSGHFLFGRCSLSLTGLWSSWWGLAVRLSNLEKWQISTITSLSSTTTSNASSWLASLLYPAVRIRKVSPVQEILIFLASGMSCSFLTSVLVVDKLYFNCLHESDCKSKLHQVPLWPAL